MKRGEQRTRNTQVDERVEMSAWHAGLLVGRVPRGAGNAHEEGESENDQLGVHG